MAKRETCSCGVVLDVDAVADFHEGFGWGKRCPVCKAPLDAVAAGEAGQGESSGEPEPGAA